MSRNFQQRSGKASDLRYLHGLPLSPGVFQGSKAEGRKNLAKNSTPAYNAGMGHRTSTKSSIPYSVDCPTCTPAFWAPGKTPYILQVVFHNVSSCPTWPDFPNGILIDAYQRDVTPCLWQGGATIDGVQWGLYLNLTVASLRLDMLIPSILPAFYAEDFPCSEGPYDNTLTCPGSVAAGGRGYILGIPPPVIKKLAKDMNLQPAQDALYDLDRDSKVGHDIVRLTGRKGSGSILIDYERP